MRNRNRSGRFLRRSYDAVKENAQTLEADLVPCMASPCGIAGSDVELRTAHRMEHLAQRHRTWCATAPPCNLEADISHNGSQGHQPYHSPPGASCEETDKTIRRTRRMRTEEATKRLVDSTGDRHDGYDKHGKRHPSDNRPVAILWHLRIHDRRVADSPQSRHKGPQERSRPAEDSQDQEDREQGSAIVCCAHRPSNRCAEPSVDPQFDDSAVIVSSLSA